MGNESVGDNASLSYPCEHTQQNLNMFYVDFWENILKQDIILT